MGLVKRAGDLVYTFRFLRLLTTSFEDTDAFKAGIIDKNGKRNKDFDTRDIKNKDVFRNSYTPFHRLVFNIKKLMAKVPGGSSKFASYASALYLLKEQFSLSDKKINEGLEAMGVDPLDFLAEQSEWFVLPDRRLSPGVYKVLESKLLNDTLDEIVMARDKILIDEDCYPVGELFGLSIYEATHVRTRKAVYITVGEIAR
tara:strand:+ start:3204 stop:3803 length:600 start_codon:yes stop_codon:yes gene_type:complete